MKENLPETDPKRLQPRAPFSLRRHLFKQIVSGLFVLLPLLATVFLLLYLGRLLAGWGRIWIAWLIPDTVPAFALNILAATLTLLVVYLVGVLTTFTFTRKFGVLGERLLSLIPVVSTVYDKIKRLVGIFRQSSGNFKAVVLVNYPHEKSKALAFVTGTIRDPQGRKLYNVFMPTTPNPTTGFLLILPLEQIQFTDIDIDAGSDLLISGGLRGPESYHLVEPFL